MRPAHTRLAGEPGDPARARSRRADRAGLRARATAVGPTLLLVSTLCSADPKGPVIGDFGFDWLRPDAARCEAVTERLLKRFRACEYRKSGAFGLSDPVHVCRVGERSEYLVFETKRACIDNLATMKANAP